MIWWILGTLYIVGFVVFARQFLWRHDKDGTYLFTPLEGFGTAAFWPVCVAVDVVFGLWVGLWDFVFRPCVKALFMPAKIRKADKGGKVLWF